MARRNRTKIKTREFRYKGSSSTGSGGYMPHSYGQYGLSRSGGHGRSGGYASGGKYSRRVEKPETQEDRDRKYKRRLIIAVAGTVLVLAAIAIGVVKLLDVFGIEDGPRKGEEVTVVIPAGSSTMEAADRLKKAGVINNAREFTTFVAEQGQAQNIKPGTYKFKAGDDFQTILDALVAGPSTDGVMLTIPEGWTVERTAERVEEVCGIPADEFLAIAQHKAADYEEEYPFLEGAYDGSMEGFLFPKTYNIANGSTADDVIRIMLNQYALETADIDFAVMAEKGYSEYDVLKVASMIEKETAVADERPLVASVIYNRLEDGWYLGIDATIIYALGGDTELDADKLAIDSPYNTRIYKGLTPSPICNPSLESIKAAADPANTDYYYYVAKSATGDEHNFAKTEEEFLRYKQEYQSTL